MKKIIVLIGIFCFATSLFAVHNPTMEAIGKMKADVIKALNIGAIGYGFETIEIIDGSIRDIAAPIDNTWDFPIEGAQGFSVTVTCNGPTCDDNTAAPVLTGDWYYDGGETPAVITGGTGTYNNPQFTVFYQLDQIDASGTSVLVGSYRYTLGVDVQYDGM